MMKLYRKLFYFLFLLHVVPSVRLTKAYHHNLGIQGWGLEISLVKLVRVQGFHQLLK